MENKNIKPTNRGKIFVGILAIILIILCYFVISRFIDRHTFVTTDYAKITGDLQRANPRIVGKIAVIKVKEGDAVKKGEVLYSLETDRLVALVKQAEARLEIAKAQLNRALGTPTKNMAILVNTVKAAQATLDINNLSLSFASVKAPSDGTIIQISSHVGDTVSPGSSVMFILDLTKLKATAYIKQYDLKNVKANHRVKLSICAFPGKSYEGKVIKIGYATTSAFSSSGNSNLSNGNTGIGQRIPVTIDFNYKNTPIIPGMSVRAKIRIAK
jgi:RND family efflux transporter MFP subunit